MEKNLGLDMCLYQPMGCTPTREGPHASDKKNGRMDEKRGERARAHPTARWTAQSNGSAARWKREPCKEIARSTLHDMAFPIWRRTPCRHNDVEIGRKPWRASSSLTLARRSMTEFQWYRCT